MNQIKPWTQAELDELDRKVDDEFKRIGIVDWAIGLLSVGMLWALYERLNKPIYKNLDAFVAANIRKDHVMGKTSPGGALAQVENIKDILPFNPIQRNALKFAQLHGAEYIAKMADSTKHAMRMLLVRSRLENTHPSQLAEQMRKIIGDMDRDWRRIAVTESASIAANGYVLSQGEGQQVVGQSAVDACPWCRDMIHGKIFTVTHQPPTNPTDPMWDDFIWPGKNNIQRSRHLRKKGGISRGVGDLWKPCIPLHCHCRCRWVVYNPRFHEVTPEGNLKAK